MVRKGVAKKGTDKRRGGREEDRVLGWRITVGMGESGARENRGIDGLLFPPGIRHREGTRSTRT